MRQLLAILIILIILTPIFFQIVFTIRRIKKKTSHSIFMIFLLTLGFVIVCTFCAAMIFIGMIEFGKNSEDIYCINGIQVFPLFGIVTALIIAPLIGVIGGFIQFLKKKDHFSIKTPGNG